MKQQYLRLGVDDVVECSIEWDSPDDGPSYPLPPAGEGTRWVLHAGEFSRTGRAEYEVPYWVDGFIEWRVSLPLEKYKQVKQAEITAQRLAADADHFVYLDKRIKTADKDMFDLLTTAAYVNTFGEFDEDWPSGWKTMDNSYLAITTVDEWKLFFKAMYRAGIANFRRSQQLKAQIEQATSVEQLTSINWNTETA